MGTKAIRAPFHLSLVNVFSKPVPRGTASAATTRPVLAKALGQTHWRYAMRFNRRYRRSGHLWQNRFYSSPLGPSHLLPALAYVDLNPVRAGLVGDAAEYPWSSARAHLEGLDQLRLLDDGEWAFQAFQGQAP